MFLVTTRKKKSKLQIVEQGVLKETLLILSAFSLRTFKKVPDAHVQQRISFSGATTPPYGYSPLKAGSSSLQEESELQIIGQGGLKGRDVADSLLFFFPQIFKESARRPCPKTHLLFRRQRDWEATTPPYGYSPLKAGSSSLQEESELQIIGQGGLKGTGRC
ncbi:hypothetical protein CEXT_695461 [Caerostris extrusa]|uniref:Uncharacterized protein n=1 Tax=Caerostris extrusa TaxID=172846 RepID=A0AAV4R1X6_CAEEX|nr:hypothetical protein CEXT_695461 [Caerostris extrusa]